MQGVFQPVWIHGEGLRIDVDEDRRGAAAPDGRGRRDRRMRNRQDAIAAAHSQRAQRQLDRVRAVGDRDTERRTDIGGELPLELPDLRAEYIPAVFQCPQTAASISAWEAR